MISGIGEVLRLHPKPLQAALNLDASAARIEVQCLLQAVLQVNRAYLLTHPERILNDDEMARYHALFQRRINGEPIAYLLGEREFYGLNLKVTPATLIPRPDTELLVELALQRIPQPLHAPHLTRGGREAANYDMGSPAQVLHAPPLTRGGWEGFGFRVLDMGTGSGAIALSIAHARPDIEVVAVDASEAALGVARENAQRLNIPNVRLLHSDWFVALAGERFDLIVSNPPYIAADDEHLSQGDVRFEPLSALASGRDGLDDIRRILKDAGDHLNPGGWLMFEHGYDQAERVRRLMLQAGFLEIASVNDLSGIERVTVGCVST